MPDKPRPWWKQVPEGDALSSTASTATTSTNVTNANEGGGASTRSPVPSPPGAEWVDGETREVQGSGRKPYVLKNTGGVYSCTCPAWMNQGVPIERRTCKHLRATRGAEVEDARVGAAITRAGAVVPGSTRSETIAAGVAPPLLLAHSWENDVDLTGWWMSEKLDGVRAYWNGAQLLSRLGNAFVAPDWFVESLPKDVHLDGELFGGRKRFQRTVSIVRRQDRSEAWREISFLVFDAPKHGGPFEERMAFVASTVAEIRRSHVQSHEHTTCRGTDHLREELARVEGLGGEGLMMRSPGSRYEVGRSHTLLKVKTFRDAEGRVVAHLPGAGKHKGKLGALSCALPDGTLFSVGTGLSDEERRNPPPVGSVITFRYQELSNDGVPRFPSYVGVRADVAWPPVQDTTTSTTPGARPVASRTSSSSPSASSASAPSPSSASRTSRTTTRDARILHRDGVTWEITLAGRSHAVRQARGEAVETSTTTFSGGAAAWRDAERRIAERIAEGWVEIEDDGVEDAS